MKNLKNIITEKLILNKNIKSYTYNYYPKDKSELKKLIQKLLKERGQDGNLNDIDTSKITDMSYLFFLEFPHKINISNWDVSNVENMLLMFGSCRNFNCNLSKWDVSKVINMKYMFKDCNKFEGVGLDNWDISKVKNMSGIFSGCDNLKRYPKWWYY